MKIGFHCWEFPPTIVGGLGTYAQCVTEALAERGHDLVVWAPEQRGWRPSVPPVKSSRVQVVRLPLFDASPFFPHVISEELSRWNGFFSDLLTYNVQAAAETRRRDDLDVVAVQDWLSGMAGLMLVRERLAPLVFHVHSTEWGRQPGGGSRPVHHFEGAMAYEADAIITVSKAMRDDLIAHGWDAAKIHAIWNGVDPERYQPDTASQEEVRAVRASYGVPDGAPLLLYVGRLTAVKGADRLVEAMPRVLAECPDARLIILGVGELEGPVEAAVRRLGLSARVALRFEFIAEAERIANYQACDLAVFPSHYEPFGIVCLEAMAMGKPVVVGARDIVGFREQAIPGGAGQTGVHVNGADPADIAWGITTALRDPAQMQLWGRHARQRVLDHFTWQHAAAKTEAVYRQAADTFRAQRHAG